LGEIASTFDLPSGSKALVKKDTSYVLIYYYEFDPEHKALSSKTSILIVVEKSYNLEGSMDEILRELDAEKAQITVSTEIRRFNKPVTIVQGLQDNKDALSITKNLKNKIGTGGTFKEGKIMLQGNHKDKVAKLLIAIGFDEKILAIR
jgi:translation initiation factor 1